MTHQASRFRRNPIAYTTNPKSGHSGVDVDLADTPTSPPAQLAMRNVARNDKCQRSNMTAGTSQNEPMDIQLLDAFRTRLSRYSSCDLESHYVVGKTDCKFCGKLLIAS